MVQENMRTSEKNAFLLFIVLVSVAFAWILLPFYGAILWGTVLAILFVPLHRRLLHLTGNRRTFAAFSMLLTIVMIVIIPVTLVGVSLVQEAVDVYGKIQSGEMDLVRAFKQIHDALPNWIVTHLDQSGLKSLSAAQKTITDALMMGSQYVAIQALSLGQSMFELTLNLFVMLYLLFYFLRDEEALSNRLQRAIPLNTELQEAFVLKFTIVIRAIMKGDMLVALLQGTLGGLIFWFLGIGAPLLWGTVMAFLSLVPAIGAALIWIPVAVYLLAIGAIWKSVVLIVFGSLVIGLLDNFLRPILVGNDTKLPDYVVLISTLGGIATFGINGVVIGPVIAALFIAAWDIFSISRQDRERKNHSQL